MVNVDYGGVTTPSLVAICLGGSLFLVSIAAVTCLCYRRKAPYTPAGLASSLRRGTRHAAPPTVLRRPTAVRSPSGPGPMLKKTPSPTGAKSPPDQKTSECGHGLGSVELGDTENLTTHQQPTVRFQTENEMDGNGEKIPTPTKEVEKETNEKLEAEEVGRWGGRLGKLEFRLLYNRQKCSLVVTIVRCSQLPAHSSDPYVKLQLLPDKQHKVKTRVLRKTQNPVYDEDFTFYGLNPNQMRGIALHFVVLSFDRYSRDEVIGEVICPLKSIDLSDAVTDQGLTVTRDISPRNLKMRNQQGRGELLISLCHQPAANRLTVVVLKARNLPKMDITGLSDPYVKIYLLYNNQRIAKKKTHVKKRTLNPVFNESFVFDVPCNEGVHGLSLEFLVLDWDRVTKNEVIGRLELGMQSRGSAFDHWTEVCNSPRRQIAEWHKLRD